MKSLMNSAKRAEKSITRRCNVNRIAIVGAGLIGRLAALALSNLGHQACLYDKDQKSGRHSAANAAGGLLTPLGEALNCAPWIVEMGFASLELWPKLLAGLERDVFFAQRGSIALAHQQDQGDMLRFSRHLQNHWSHYDLEFVGRSELQTLESQLAGQFSTGLYLPQEGQIANRMLLEALAHELDKAKVNWHSGSAIEDVSVLQSDFDLVIDCRGVGAKEQIKTLRGVRGELFILHAPEVKLTRPIRLMHPRYNLYIAPKPNAQYIIGATEIESDDSSPMTVRSALELLSAAYSVHPGFAEATILEQVSSTRPAYADNHPKISVKGSLISVNGLYRHGFLIAPSVLNHLLQVINSLNGRATESYQFPQLVEQL